MAAPATKSRVVEWEQAFIYYVDLNLRLGQAETAAECEALGQAIALHQDKLMHLRAPHLSGILQKLYILWGETDLHDLDRESEEKRLLLEDFEELLGQSARLLGMAPEQQPVRTLGLWPELAPRTDAKHA